MSKTVTCNTDPIALEPLIDNWLLEVNNGKFGLNIDKQKAINDLRGMVLSSDAELFLLVVEDDVVGFCGVLLYENRLTDHNIANEHYLYVDPKYRRGVKNPNKLIRAIENWASEHNCSHIITNASYLASDRHDGVVKIYERLGYEPFESSFIKRLEVA